MLPTPFDLEKINRMHVEELRSDAKQFSLIKLVRKASNKFLTGLTIKKEQVAKKSSSFFPAK